MAKNNKKDEEEKKFYYKSKTIYIKKGHKLYNYFENMGVLVNNMYNTTNYYIRQAYFAFIYKRDNPKIFEAIDYINSAIPDINKTRVTKKNKDGKYPKPFNLLSEKKPFTNVRTLDSVFRKLKNKDFEALPAHVNYNTMQEVFEAWSAYYAEKRDYKVNPHKYTGEPRPPHYGKKNTFRTICYSNINCKLKDNDQKLIFPKTKTRLNIGKIFKDEIGTISEVKVKKDHGLFKVEIVLKYKIEDIKANPDKTKAIGIDLGVNNFAVISSNIGQNPIIINGKYIKHVNHLYNKNRAKYYGIIRTGKKKKEGTFNTKLLDSITLNRNRRIKDFMHKTSRAVINYCVKNDIGIIVIGKNTGWKENVKLRKKDKQNFIQIPYSMFTEMLKYKGFEHGITVKVREESYTSKASFIDDDNIPDYNFEEKGTHLFSGKRTSRGLYVSKGKIKLNADVNGSYNILRKEIGHIDINIDKICNPIRIQNVASKCLI